MTSRKYAMLAMLILSIQFLQGCTGTPVHMGVSKEFNRDLYSMDKPKNISASSSGFQLLIFIPININDRQARAYKKIQRLADDGLISDVKVKESWKYAFVGTIYNTTIEATVYPKKP